jgi:hypothetical protein
MRFLTVFVLTAALAVLAGAGTAGADSVSYTVGGWVTQLPGPLTPPVGSPWGPNGYPGDTVEYKTYTGTLDLTPGTYVQKISTLLWKIDYTYGGTPEPWPDMPLTFDATPNMSFVGGSSGNLNQTGLDLVNWVNDYLSLSPGSTTSFFIDNTYRIDVTPLGLPKVGGSNFDGDNPWTQPSRDVMATFEVTAIPEPLTMAGLFLGLAGVGGYIRKRRMA